MSSVFVDSSVLFAAAYSTHSSARDLLMLAIDGHVQIVLSDLVLLEAERNVIRKAPAKLESFREIVSQVPYTLAPAIIRPDIEAAADYVAIKDAPIIAAAIKANATIVATYDRKHLIDPPTVAQRSGLRIVTPDVIVGELRQSLESEHTDSEPSDGE